MIAPIVHAHAAWLLHPQELSEWMARSTQELFALQAHAGRRMLGISEDDVVLPNADDQRFADPVWTQSAGWDVLKQYYLFFTRNVQDALFQTPGLAPKERRRAAFWWRKSLNMVAPTNYFLTNLVAVRKAIETNGQSLVKGLDELVKDLRAGTVRMTSPEDFEVGSNLATTPGEVVFRNRLIELIHYTPMTHKVQEVPIVIVMPWINKFYVLDLTPKKSMVQYLLKQGFSVFIVSWKNPTADMAGVSFDDYLTDGVDAAVNVAREITGAPRVHAAGYCIGGTLLATYMAWLNRRHEHEKDVPVAHWTLFTTMTDFQSPGDIEVFLDEGSVRWICSNMRTQGYLDGREMASTFRLMRSNSLIWHYVVHSWLYGERPPPFDVLYWNMDTTRMPAAMHEFYLREMYLNNRLIKADSLVIAGEPISLERIRQPLYAVSAEDDHVAPWRQTFRINQWVQAPKRYVLSSSGHILGIVNPPAKPPKRKFWVGAAHRRHTADVWRKGAEEHDGTWWEDWVAWLRPQCGALMDPPPISTGDFPKLDDAPGTYVLER
ncbi:MAG: alpha/beta fold hydrolase [Betaproteobacteria bacterium]|nr:alpha/beta fold hydrolase [Betaproteobacteria bacterium]